MNREERAKQFMPFDALKGLREELRLRERIALRTERRELFEEEGACLSQALAALMPGQTVTLLYYDGGHYRTLSGEVLGVDTVYERLLLLVKGEKRAVALRDLYRLWEA